MNTTGRSTIAGNPVAGGSAAFVAERSPCLGRLIAFLSSAQRSAAEVQAYLGRAGIGTADLEPWAAYNHPAEESYGRTPLWHNDYWGMYVMSWLPGDATAVHSHGNTEHGVVLFCGRAVHRSYTVAGSTVRLAKKEYLEPGAILAICDGQFFHAMGNPGSEPFMTLHLYGAADSHGHSTAGAVVIELEKRRKSRSRGPAFITMPAEVCSAVEYAVETDEAGLADYLDHIGGFYRRQGTEVGSRFF